MTLDITKVAAQIQSMVARIKSDRPETRQHLNLALEKLKDRTINPEALKRKIATARTPWPVAGLWEGLDLHFPAPHLPPTHCVLATDGSHINVDRHRAARCYLINLGVVSLNYGDDPSAELESLPTLYSEEKDLVIRDPNNLNREQSIEGPLLDAKRSTAECLKISEMACALPPDRPALALLDGSLVLFGMENYPLFVVEELVDDNFLPALDKIKNLSLERQISLASYISLPRSSDVVNALRVAVCPQATADCDAHCSAGNCACEVFSGINDRMLFNALLAPGERSAMFINPSSIMKRYGQHAVYFFYLKSEDEIARVEIPEWVARNTTLVNLTHSVILDQCRKGQGYPVALSEAHEKAVVSGADREEFWAVVEESLQDEKIETYTSAKNQSKRTRWI